MQLIEVDTAGHPVAELVLTIPAYYMEDGKLYIPDIYHIEDNILLYPETRLRYFSPSRGYQLEFVLDETGKAETVQVMLEGMQFTAARKE